MTAELLASLAGLAVLDMLSPTLVAVTLGVLLRAPRGAVRLLVVYWCSVATAYLALGAVLVLGLGAVVDAVDPVVVTWLQFAVGIALLVGSFFVTGADPDRAARRTTPRAPTASAMVALGLGTWLLEAATAVPYLAAVALVTAADLGPGQWVPLLAGYCAAMLLPGVALLAAWALAGARLRSRAERWRAGLTRGSRTAVSWVVGIAGVLVARDAAWRLLLAHGVVDVPV